MSNNPGTPKGGRKFFSSKRRAAKAEQQEGSKKKRLPTKDLSQKEDRRR